MKVEIFDFITENHPNLRGNCYQTLTKEGLFNSRHLLTYGEGGVAPPPPTKKNNKIIMGKIIGEQPTGTFF